MNIVNLAADPAAFQVAEGVNRSVLMGGFFRAGDVVKFAPGGAAIMRVQRVERSAEGARLIGVHCFGGAVAADAAACTLASRDELALWKLENGG